MILLAYIVGLVGFLLAFVALIRTFSRTETRPLPQPVLGHFTDALAGAIPITKTGREQLTKDLIRSGHLHESATNNYLASRNCAFLAWIIFAVAITTLELIQFNSTWFWVFVAGAVLILALPRTLTSLSSASRAQRISHDLPDALDLLAMMMSGGMTMQESLTSVIGEFDESHPALAFELKVMARQANTGTLDGALVSFADRLDLPEVTALTAMLRGGHRAGGSLVDSLRTFSDGLRHNRDQAAKERGNKASIKLLLPVVFFLAPPIYILLLGPAFLDLKDFVEKENQPGGALAPVVQQTRPQSGQLRITNARTGADTSSNR